MELVQVEIIIQNTDSVQSSNTALSLEKICYFDKYSTYKVAEFPEMSNRLLSQKI